MRILVTGGAGYIGSHVVRALRASGHEPVVLDDLREGHRAAVGEARLVKGDIADSAAIEEALRFGPVDGVVHMAASCLVGESMQQPGRYFDNNVSRSLRLIELIVSKGVNRFVFSSTAAVYGDPASSPGEPIREDHPCLPTNVYGETKLAVERVLSWYSRCRGLGAVSLRYFNAAGADPAGDLGEDHDPETHLIPLVMKAALGQIPHVTVLGRDYPTPDGTCLRDYIHVSDLAAAHVLALEKLGGSGSFLVYNLGAEKAASVLEVIEAARRISSRRISTSDAGRRAGDPPVLLASSERIRRELGWRPEMSSLEAILTSAWRWHREHPTGFGGS